jgi:hypothetical protein
MCANLGLVGFWAYRCRWFLVVLNVPIMALGFMAVSLRGAYLGAQGRAVPRQHEAVSRSNRNLYD